jgi:hypothetical protein
MKKYNNVSGTTSSDFTIGVGKANTTHHVINAVCSSANVFAKDKFDKQLTVNGVEFYDMKIVAKNSDGLVMAKQLRGTVNGIVISRIEDVFQEDFAADVVLTSNGVTLSVECIHTDSLTQYTIYATMTSVEI